MGRKRKGSGGDKKNKKPKLTFKPEEIKQDIRGKKILLLTEQITAETFEMEAALYAYGAKSVSSMILAIPRFSHNKDVNESCLACVIDEYHEKSRGALKLCVEGKFLSKFKEKTNKK